MRSYWFFVLFLWEFSHALFAQNPNLQITHLKDNFYVFTTYNTFKGELFSAHGMYLLTQEGAILFDTPWDTTQYAPLMDSIRSKHHQKILLCIATHAHEDRAGGLAYYQKQGIRTYTTLQTAQLCQKQNQTIAEVCMTKDTTFRVGTYTFETYYPGAGHTEDNIVIWFEKEKILYGGCLIKSVEATNLGNLADAHVEAWAQSIRNIQKRMKKPHFVITGHQSWENPNALKHTLKLIRQHHKKIKNKVSRAK